MLWQKDVSLSPLGTFQAEFVLPATSPQGEYRIAARDDAGHNYQGTPPRPTAWHGKRWGVFEAPKICARMQA